MLFLLDSTNKQIVSDTVQGSPELELGASRQIMVSDIISFDFFFFNEFLKVIFTADMGLEFMTLISRVSHSPD